VAHVLGKFEVSEKGEVDRSVERAADAVESIVSDGIERAMDRFNGPA